MKFAKIQWFYHMIHHYEICVNFWAKLTKNKAKLDPASSKLQNARSRSSEGVGSSDFRSNSVLIKILKIWCGFLKSYVDFAHFASKFNWMVLRAQKELSVQILFLETFKLWFSQFHIRFLKITRGFYTILVFYCAIIINLNEITQSTLKSSTTSASSLPRTFWMI